MILMPLINYLFLDKIDRLNFFYPIVGILNDYLLGF